MAAKSSTPSFILELPVITFVFIKNTAPAIWELVKKEKESNDRSISRGSVYNSTQASSLGCLYVFLYIMCFWYYMAFVFSLPKSGNEN